MQSRLKNHHNYGENYQLHLLEQYKMYVEMADRVSARRQQVGSFYISILSGLLGLLAINNKELFSGSQNIVLLSISILGITLCILWNANINSYKQLNSLKFKVIHEMEANLPFACYEREWEILKESKSNVRYFRLTAIEKYVPFVLCIPYTIILIQALISLFK